MVREARRCLTSPGSTPKGYTLRHPMMKPTSSRIAYLDNLRILVTILVVLHHVAITYGAPGDWYFYDTPVSELGIVLLTIFVALNSSFFMGLFFLLAGYFTPRSRDRREMRGEHPRQRCLRATRRNAAQALRVDGCPSLGRVVVGIGPRPRIMRAFNRQRPRVAPRATRLGSP